MLKLLRTDAKDSTFRKLVKDLDEFLAVTDGDDHDFYNQYNKLDNIKFVVVLYKNDKPIGCGAIKQYDKLRYEVKRMYIDESHRGNGYGGIIIEGLEKWAKELGAKMFILETGIRQTGAIRLYQKNGYCEINNYGQYAGVEDSICFQKEI